MNSKLVVSNLHYNVTVKDLIVRSALLGATQIHF